MWDGDRSRVSVFSPSYEWVRDVRVSPAWLVRSTAWPVRRDSWDGPTGAEYMDDALRTLRVCRGATELTTNPADVVEFDGHTARIRWGEYVHVASVLPLDSNLFLVTIRAPGDDRRVLQVVSRQCELVAEMEIDFPITPKAVQGELIAAVRTLDYPEVVIYRATMVGP